jgi:anti-sigma factor RsiW
MMPLQAHYGNELHDLLDKRLNANVRREVESHLETCRDCRRRFEALEWAKAAMRTLPVKDAPGGLRADIENALRRERTEVARFSSAPRRWSNNTAIVVAFAILLGLAAILVNLTRDAPATVADLVMEDFRNVQDGDLQLDSASPSVIGGFFEGYEIPFHVRVFESGPAGLAPSGCRVEGLGERPRALVAYRDAGGGVLVCEMFEGGPVDLPAEGMIRERNGVRFRVMRAGDLSAVFWLEGPVVYSIVAETDSEQLLLLAATLARK